MKVGFVGIGNMGSAMARNLIKAGHTLVLYNKNAKSWMNCGQEPPLKAWAKPTGPRLPAFRFAKPASEESRVDNSNRHTVRVETALSH
jgi:3-hydroxyacyl-CoA dehydrogenase